MGDDWTEHDFEREALDRSAPEPDDPEPPVARLIFRQDWARQPHGGLYDVAAAGWWLPPHPAAGLGVATLKPDRGVG